MWGGVSRVLWIRELPNLTVNQVKGRRFHRNPAHQTASFALTVTLRGALALRVRRFRFRWEHLSSVRDKGALPSATQQRSVHAGHKCSVALYTSIIRMCALTPCRAVWCSFRQLFFQFKETVTVWLINTQTTTLFYQQWAHSWSTESRSVQRSGFSPQELALTVRRCYAFLLLRLFFFSHHSWAFHNHPTMRAQRRGNLNDQRAALNCPFSWSTTVLARPAPRAPLIGFEAARLTRRIRRKTHAHCTHLDVTAQLQGNGSVLA